MNAFPITKSRFGFALLMLVATACAVEPVESDDDGEDNATTSAQATTSTTTSSSGSGGSNSTTRAFGAPCAGAGDCDSGLCIHLQAGGDEWELTGDGTLSAADGMCSIACDFNEDCPPPGSGLDPADFYCADTDFGETATNPDGRYCVMQ